MHIGELGGRRPCPADTSAGVALMKSTRGPRLAYWASTRIAFCLEPTRLPAGPAPYFGVFEMWGPVFRQLTPEASLKVRKGNYERLFDAAR